MNEASRIENGLYRLIKHEEDQNPAFPSNETIVEIRNGLVINLSTGREWPLEAIGKERSLYGPLSGPYDLSPLDTLPRIFLEAPPVIASAGEPADEDVR